jgi:hypothetical protein
MTPPARSKFQEAISAGMKLHWKKRKYRNNSVTMDGMRFDSQAEARRWAELKLLERAGVISGLRRQVTFPIIWNSVKICDYRADFVYISQGELRPTLEDVKGFATPEYRIKAKLMAAQGLPITEVRT